MTEIYPSLEDLPQNGPTAEELLPRIDAGIVISWRVLSDARKGRLPRGAGGDAEQIAVLLDRLIEIRNEIHDGRAPGPVAHRMTRSRSWIFGDSWDPDSPFGRYLGGLMFLYEQRMRPPAGPVPMAMPRDVAAVASKREEERGKEVDPPVEIDPDARHMPHQPMPEALHTLLKAAEGFIAHREPFLDRLDANATWVLGQQFGIRAYVGYWLQRPTPAVVKDLRRACRIGWKGVAKGYPAHIWDLQQLFVDSVASGADETAGHVIARKEADWNLPRVRPVPWLSARLRCLFALHRGDDSGLPMLLEDARRATFVDVLPPELEPDKPLMFNAYHCVRAVAERDQPQFARTLAERMDLLAKHYHRNLAPVALADTFGLALCRWARARGLAVGVEHVYLPLDWLDQPAEG